ncbi:DUF2339 domain-containing protein [Maribacter sp. 4G9]|uniref:DUF2339 domain-containing protein n=1 Tax=Maribacter sp. 4G9 TaxID=1889777 RepID=UPI000C15B041|nr:DUF2339 domain-containing protein [Maribacter sp. 4G9]PIB25322.1 hypothetical protein BFP75_09840 [Maribacter sp. 4G9]
MAENNEQISRLLERLELLLRRQQDFNLEVEQLRKEIQILKKEQTEFVVREVSPEEVEKVSPLAPMPPLSTQIASKETVSHIEPPRNNPSPQIKTPKGKSNLEKFIGENLINKIGILITVIGVVIGAKYSIENNLISPLTRIILGYLVGLGLIGFGIKLKAKYTSYSAVLISGALAILYFITFAAYSLYGLFPQPIAFGIMLIFTVFGVVSALNYNKQIIAHIGLVGAYAIPFLLSNDSGNAQVLFAYITIINIGILVISLKKYWKALYYVAFAFSWLIYAAWAAFSYQREAHFTLALTVIFIFFATFYITFLAYKLIQSEKFKASDVMMLVLNSFLFYGLGIGLLSFHETGKEFLGLFTLVNALIHFAVSLVLFKRKMADRNLFFLIAGLVLTFITIAIPVQLDGNWVTLLWALEATLLFYIGRTKKVPTYEYLSYPLMILAFISLIQDWSESYSTYYYTADTQRLIPLFNTAFLTSMVFLITFGGINWINNKFEHKSSEGKKGVFSKIMSFAIPGVLLLVLYCSFYLEIEYYFDGLFQKSEVMITDESSYTYPQNNYNIRDQGDIWLLNYTLFFITTLIFINSKRLKNRVLGIISLSLGILVGGVFLTAGLYLASELRESYISKHLAEFYEVGHFNLYIRYVAIAFFALLVVSLYRLIRQPFMRVRFEIPFHSLLHVSILWILSSELLHWMDLFGSNQSYKLGLSILWGSYSLFLIAFGIWKKQKYLRIIAIVLFGITLIKLFLYDIASLNTISKTIVFVSLGILLLVISFLYNKYKQIIADENEN